MQNTRKEEFETLWKDFLTVMKGRLIKAAASQRLSVSLANLLLGDVLTSWESETDGKGRWLYAMIEADGERGILVRDTLRDIRFAKVDAGKPFSPALDVIVPLGGAAAGLAVSWMLGCGRWVQAVSAAVPGILLMPAMKTLRKQKLETMRETAIRLYMEQLDKYHDSILPMLEE